MRPFSQAECELFTVRSIPSHCFLMVVSARIRGRKSWICPTDSSTSEVNQFLMGIACIFLSLIIDILDPSGSTCPKTRDLRRIWLRLKFIYVRCTKFFFIPFPVLVRQHRAVPFQIQNLPLPLCLHLHLALPRHLHHFWGAPNPRAPAPASSTSNKKDEIDPAALKYYKSIRGLNVSFLSAISKAVEQDPFTDVSDMVSHDKNFGVSVQKEFDEWPKVAQNKSVDGSSVSSSSAPTSKPPPTMSSGFTGFGKPPGTTPTTGASHRKPM
jgi:hypothetical protein